MEWNICKNNDLMHVEYPRARLGLCEENENV